MNGTIIIGLISEKKLSDYHLIKFTRKLADTFVFFHGNITLGSNYKILDILFDNRFEYDIIIYFYKKDILNEYKKYNMIYNDKLYKIFKKYSDIMADYNINPVYISQS